MGSMSEAGELCSHFGHRKGIRLSPVAHRRRMIRGKATMKSSNCVLQHPSLVESEHDFMSSIPTHAVFIFLNPLMVDLLQVEYQNKKVSPFETHAPNMWIFFVATCVHCLGLAFEVKIQNSGAHCGKVFSNFVLFSGALSSVSLASVFLPKLLGWICLGLWTILPFASVFPFIVAAFKELYLKTREALARVCMKSAEFMRSFNLQKTSLPK